MEFNHWKSTFVTAKEYFKHRLEPANYNKLVKSQTYQEFYLTFYREMMANKAPDYVNLAVAENHWYEKKEPYYNVWPGIIEPLSRVKHDKIPSTHLHLVEPVIVFRLPVDEKRLTLSGDPIRTMLVTIGRTEEGSKTGCTQMMSVFVQTDKIRVVEGTGLQKGSQFYLGLRDDLSVAEAFQRIQQIFGQGFTEEEIAETHKILSLVTGVCLLSTDKADALVIPDVINADREKFEKTHDEKYVDRARRRGKNGWDVGRNITVSPHWRRGHFMTLKAGVAGRAVQRLVWRRDTVVKRAVAEQMPTGYEATEDSVNVYRGPEESSPEKE